VDRKMDERTSKFDEMYLCLYLDGLKIDYLIGICKC
jgi:hypothetical protein